MSESQEHPAPARSEISSPPITEISKTKAEKSLQKPKKGISKKQLAQRLVASAVIAVNMGLPADHVSSSLSPEEPRGITQELSLQDLEKRVETLYQIDLITPEELPEVEIDNEKLKTLEWTREGLGRLMTDLDRLPPHFYSPTPLEYRLELANLTNLPESSIQLSYESILGQLKENLGEDFFLSREDYDKAREQGYFSHILGFSPKEFILVNPRDSQDSEKWVGQCLCGNRGPDAQSKILFDYRWFRDEVGLQRFLTVAHELTHSIATQDDHKFVADLLEVSLGDQEKIKEFLAPNIGRVKERFGSGVGEDFVYASKNTSEFLSVGGGVYLGGEERFRDVYGVFIGEEKAGQLYDYMRDNIFKGTEYKDYQKIVK